MVCVCDRSLRNPHLLEHPVAPSARSLVGFVRPAPYSALGGVDDLAVYCHGLHHGPRARGAKDNV